MRSSTKHPRSGSPSARVLYLIVVASLIGCERSSAPGLGRAPEKGASITLIGPARSSPQVAGIIGGARRVIARFPLLRLETCTPSDNSIEALAATVQNALAEHPNAVCLYLRDADAARAVVDEILQSDAILVTMGTQSAAGGVFAHVDDGWARAAELLGESLIAIAPNKRSYLLLHSNGASEIATNCYNRFMLTARKQYAMKLLHAQDTTEADRPQADLVRAMFTQFRHAGLVVTLDPRPWLDSDPADLLGGDARFATLSAAPALWPALRSGTAAGLVGPIDGETGALAIEAAIGGLTESRESGAVHFTTCQLVTADTLDDFATRYAQAAGLDLNELQSTPPRPSTRPAASP